jgi:polyhydroxyalkanoate synthesis regulator phasin
MATNEFLKRYLDLGLALASPTQARAEALVKELVKAGEVQSDQARELVAIVIERGRLNGEKLIETVRAEVKHQITSMGLASRSDIERVEQRLLSLFGSAPARTAAPPAAAPKTAAPKTAAPKTAAPKTAAKKTPAKMTPAKKTPARKTAAKKTAARKTAAKKTPARKTVARKTPAPKAPGASVMAPPVAPAVESAVGTIPEVLSP